MLAVISPAKSLDLSSPLATSQFSQPSMLESSAQLVEILSKFSPAQLASLMKLSDKLAILNCERFNDWALPFDQSNARQALLMFSGDVYTGIDANSLSEADFTYAQSHLRILSGLYGLLKPLDLIQAYRLEMGTKLENNKGANLYAFWKQAITEQLNKAIAQQGDNLLVNLASDEYFKVIDKKNLHAQIITPVFKDCKKGQFKVISFYAKKARGMMARFIIQNQVSTVEALKQFDMAGYYYCSQESSSDKLIFKREEQAL